jgi:hypothetical protein
MATRILGPTGSRRRRRFLFVPILLVACTALFLIGSAQAVHDLDFQLDGETTSTAFSPPTGSSPALDWNDLFTATGGNTSVISPAGPFTNAVFVRDFGLKVSAQDNCSLTSTDATKPFCTADATTYATGSKDTLDITPGWQCNRDNNVNSKIDIMNAYAASYTASNGDKIMYFGMEKNKDNGTNNVGFWFLQGNANCVSPGGNTPWTGTHQVGDVLVVSEFSNGGGVSSILAYRWVGGSNPLVLFGSGGDCKTASGDDTICATTNATNTAAWNQNVTTKWLTSDATLGVGNTVVPPDFFEGGINLTKAFAASGGGTVPSCFNTFIGDTRSATSLTATLFDYARGRLGECVTTLTTAAGNTQNGGTASPTSIGGGSVSSGSDTATLTISGTPTWGGTLSWYLCGPIASGLCNNTQGVPVTSRTVSNSSPATDFVSGTATLTSAGRYCWTAHFQPDQASLNAGVLPADDNGVGECFIVAPVTPTLNTSASCTNTPCVLGVDTISDTATLAGTASRPGSGGGGTPGVYTTINPTTPGAAANNSISWTLYGPSNSNCTTNSKLTTSRLVSGDGTYPTAAQAPVSYTPSLADGVGTYVFVASYPGDSPNTNAALTTGCSDTNEQVILTGSASSASKQRWLPNDRVVLTTTGGTTLDGTLTVTLYSGTFSGTASNCTAGTATAVPNQSYTFDTSPGGVPGASGTAYNTNNTAFFVGTNPDGTAGGAPGNYFWLVHYVDANLTDPPDRCESSNVTITDE